MLIDHIKTQLGLTSNSLTRKFAYFLKPENYDYMVFYPPYNNLYSADITPSRDLEEQLKQINGQEPKISFFFAIPWCRQKCPYCLYHCNVGLPSEEDQRYYLNSLIQEFKLYLKHLGQCSVDTVYIGGGTPSLLKPSLLAHFLERLSFAIGENGKSLNNLAELNFEIHPNDKYEELIPILKGYFVNHQKLRISLGAQSFIDERIQNIRDKNVYKNTHILKAFEFLCKSEVKTNVDLMWGLAIKGKSEEISNELAFIKEKKINPTTFTFYQIQSPGDIERHKNYVENIEKDTLKILHQRKEIFNTLVDSHYEPILFPAYFQNKEHGAIYNTKQMAKNCYYIGLGVSGHSKLERWAYRNTQDIKRYIELVTVGKFPIDYVTKLSDDNIKKRDNLLRMRLPDQTFQKNDLTDLFKDTTDENDIDELLETFFVKIHEKYRLNTKGKIFVDEIIRCAVKNDVSLMARFDKRIIKTYIDRNETERNDRKIENILSFMKNAVGQILVQETNIKEFVANIGYFSEHLPRPVINKNPIGLINYRDQWKKAFENFGKLQGDKLYFFSELFNSLSQIGIAYPLSFAGNAFGLDESGEVKDSEKIFKRLCDAIKRVKYFETLVGRYEKAKSQKSLSSFLAMFKLFHWYVEDLDEDSNGGQKNLYFLMTRTATASAAGAVVALRLEDPNKARLYLGDLTRYIEEIYTLVSEAEFRERMINFALVSAIAAIMSRNMSHNIGSHVIFYSASANQDYDPNEHKIFLRYLQERMEFLSLVSTTEANWGVKYGLKSLIKHFKSQKILLDNIVKSEGIDNNNVKIEIVPESKLPSGDMPDILMPHGEAGKQAIYTILENFIRNTAKHQWSTLDEKKKPETFKINVRCEEIDELPLMYKITISSNVAGCDHALIERLNVQLSEKILDDKCQLMQTNRGLKEQRISACFLRLLPVMRIEEYTPDNETKLTMKSSCKPLVKAVCTKNYGSGSLNHHICDLDDCSFGFEFYVLKPMELLWIGGHGFTSNEIGSLKDKGILVYKSVEEAENDFPKTFPSKMVLISSQYTEEWLQDNNNLRRMPYRILILNGNEAINSKWVPIESSDLPNLTNGNIDKYVDELLVFLWSNWVKGFFEKSFQPVGIKHDIYMKSKLSEPFVFHDCTELNTNCKSDYILTHGSTDQEHLFSISYGSNDSLGLLIDRSIVADHYLQWEIAEMVHIRILIVDERIYDSKNVAKDEETIEQIWARQGVDIVDDSLVITKSDNLKAMLQANDYTFLIIHQGVIDKIIKKHKDVPGFVFDIWWGDIQDEVDFTVIDSGRGEPEMVKDGKGRWLQLSDLEHHIVECCGQSDAKYNLTQVLYALREGGE